jgi:hypothetical protein
MRRTHMTPNRMRQRGEGKIGCVLSILMFALLLGIGGKLVPYWWSVDQLRDNADELASRAGLLNDDTIRAQLRAKAKDLELPEALAPNAITFRRQGSEREGAMVIELRFKREIDFYGIYKYTWVTEKRVFKPYMDAR